jgi:hypothetical protein
MDSAAPTGPSLVISALGGLNLTIDGTPLALGNRKARAMLAYLASEDDAKITRERATAEQIAPGRSGQGAFAWPTCQKAPRKTNPRLR